MVFETLNNVQNLSVQKVEEGKASDGLIRLSGVFGVCGVKNGNNRIYDKENYRVMVEALQKQIVAEGCPGELEHPNSMNIDLNNVSHKIESIEMNEDGTITGTIVLLNTDKGKNAQAMVEGGLPLFISSRGAGSIDESGHVTLTMIKTYDLVGTPGFSQAKLTLKENQHYEALNESLEDGNLMYAIVEGADDDLLGGGGDDGGKDAPKDDPKKDEPKDDPKKDEPKDEPKDNPQDNPDPNKDNNKNNSDITMNDLKEAIDKLTEQVSNLEAELHVAQESLASKDAVITELQTKVNESKIDYEAIETWVKDEFAPEFTNEIKESIITDAKNWVCESFAPLVQGWVTEEFAPTVQNWIMEEYEPEAQKWVTETFAPMVQDWITEEFAPEVQSWVTEEFAPEVQSWVTEEFAPEVQQWITEEFAPVIEGWVNDEYTPETTAKISEAVENKVNENVQKFMESQEQAKLGAVDALIESLETNKNAAIDLLKEQKQTDKYAGVICVDRMPAQYQPAWNMLSEAKKDEVVRRSKAYDFTKEGVLESFWANVKFVEPTVNEAKTDKNVVSNYQSMVAEQMKKLRFVIA